MKRKKEISQPGWLGAQLRCGWVEGRGEGENLRSKSWLRSAKRGLASVQFPWPKASPPPPPRPPRPPPLLRPPPSLPPPPLGAVVGVVVTVESRSRPRRPPGPAFALLPPSLKTCLTHARPRCGLNTRMPFRSTKPIPGAKNARLKTPPTSSLASRPHSFDLSAPSRSPLSPLDPSAPRPARPGPARFSVPARVTGVRRPSVPHSLARPRAPFPP